MTKVVIITSASRGIGEACTKELIKKGYKAVIMSRSEAIIRLAQQTGADGIQGSVTHETDLERLVSLCLEKYGRIDALVNNTGHAPKGDLLSLRDEDWKTGLDLLLLNVIRLSRLVTPVMVAQGGGAILNISSVAAFEPNGAFPVSSVFRAGLASFTKMYASQYASRGIRMNNVLPGYVDSYEVTSEILEKIPANRIGSVTEIAHTVSFLLSPEASYITGQNIRVDGGLVQSIP